MLLTCVQFATVAARKALADCLSFACGAVDCVVPNSQLRGLFLALAPYQGFTQTSVLLSLLQLCEPYYTEVLYVHAACVCLRLELAAWLAALVGRKETDHMKGLELLCSCMLAQKISPTLLAVSLFTQQQHHCCIVGSPAKQPTPRTAPACMLSMPAGYLQASRMLCFVTSCFSCLAVLVLCGRDVLLGLVWGPIKYAMAGVEAFFLLPHSSSVVRIAWLLKLRLCRIRGRRWLCRPVTLRVAARVRL